MIALGLTYETISSQVSSVPGGVGLFTTTEGALFFVAWTLARLVYIHGDCI